jgi:hypothetical protein
MTAPADVSTSELNARQWRRIADEARRMYNRDLGDLSPAQVRMVLFHLCTDDARGTMPQPSTFSPRWWHNRRVL